jgi:hypothetical protein
MLWLISSNTVRLLVAVCGVRGGKAIRAATDGDSCRYLEMAWGYCLGLVNFFLRAGWLTDSFPKSEQTYYERPY